MEYTEMYKEMFRAFHRFGKTTLELSLPEISKSEYMLMNAIYKMEKNKEQKAYVSCLAKAMCVAPSAVSRSLKTLENKGYVIRTVEVEDRRNTMVSITEAGEELRLRIETMLRRHMERITAVMGPEDMHELVRIMDRLCDATEQELKNKEDIIK